MPVDTAASNWLFLWTEAETRPGVTLRSRVSATHVVVSLSDHRSDCLPSGPMYSRPREDLLLKVYVSLLVSWPLIVQLVQSNSPGAAFLWLRALSWGWAVLSGTGSQRPRRRLPSWASELGQARLPA